MIERETLNNRLQPSLDEFKRHIRITSSDMDADLMSILKSAILEAEHQIGRVISQSRFTYSCSLQSEIVLPKVPTSEFFDKYPYLFEVEDVKVDEVSTTSYTLSDNKVILNDGVTGEKVSVVYVIGFKPVPMDMKNAILLIAAGRFQRPIDSVETLPTASSNLLRHYRNWGRYDG